LEQTRSFDVYVGGAELNVAVGVARLGLAATWVSRLPDSALGRVIASRAREQGVDVSRVAWTPDGRAGLYFAELGAAPRASTVLYDRAGSAMSGIAPDEIDWKAAQHGARWFHTSGITPALSDSAADAVAKALAAAKSAGLTVSYDLNYRSKLWSAEKARAVQEPLMRHVDVLIATEEDARVVFGITAGKAAKDYTSIDAESYAEVARQLQKRLGGGPATVAITLRENPRVWLNRWSALVLADGDIHRGPTYEVEIVDRIGAGDAFVAGLIFGKLCHGSWDAAVRYGTALSALKHTTPGDFSQSTVGEVEQLLKGASLRVSR
jgi:2-dehydro-3-deoxygluconokinase